VKTQTAPMPPDSATAEHWTIQDVTRYLRVSERTVHNYIKKGMIPRPRRLSKRWLFDAGQIKAACKE
jgi:predicted site-specific integrase-resolvase